VPPADPVQHSPIVIPNPGGRRSWVLYASHSEPIRLVVFVHGFGGKTVKTWNQFALSGHIGEWWRRSDMLFVGYHSLQERPGETAAWIRKRLSDFYPSPPADLLEADDSLVREPSKQSYSELFLVGHSLGGVILRLALLQQARSWLFEEREFDLSAARPRLLEGNLRLFSPASAGFQPAGLLAILTSVFSLGMVALEGAPSFTALRRDSELLSRTREETEALVSSHGGDLAALRAHIMWARPERVVERDGYRTDYEAESLVPERDHSEVCKPLPGYEHPRRFVETGRHG
jgi:hypothetical protein